MAYLQAKIDRLVREVKALKETPKFSFSEKIGKNKFEIKCTGKLANDVEIMTDCVNLMEKFKKKLKG